MTAISWRRVASVARFRAGAKRRDDQFLAVPPSRGRRIGHDPDRAAATAGKRTARAVTGLASLAALAVALALPVAYLISAADRMTGVLELRAQLYADSVSDAAAESPELYNALLGSAEINLDGLAIAAPDDPSIDRPAEWRKVFAADGHRLLEVAAVRPIAWPVLSSRAPVLQNGHRLGEVEINRSLRPQLLTASAIAACSFTLGLLLLIGLRMVPLRLMHEALDRASFLSAHDQLTGLPNRTLLADRLEEALSAAARPNGTQVAMFCLDLDHFKQVNDTLGHRRRRRAAAHGRDRLRHCLRESDMLARLGGDEFAVIQTEANDSHDAEALAARLIETVHEPMIIEGQQVFIGLSIGIALNAPGLDAAELTKQADIALYQAKAAGRDGYCFFAPEMNAEVLRRRAIEDDLRGALERDELEVHYQPADRPRDRRDDRRRGIDALDPPRPRRGAAECIHPDLRGNWTDRLDGRLAARRGVPRGHDMAGGDACRGERLAAAAPARRLPRHCAWRAGAIRPRSAPSRAGGDGRHPDPRHQGDVNGPGRTARDGVRRVGRFGTGYSSLGYLRKFRFDKIKIDRSFVQNLGSDPNAEAIVRAVVGLSDALGISTNAEGVENSEQAAMLRALGCREAQGFLYSKAAPRDKLHALLDPQRQAA